MEMNPIVEQALQIVFSSTRPMPAYFTSNGERKQSFCVEFDQLTEADERAMASEAWGAPNSAFPNSSIPREIFYDIIRIGEDVMLGSFIVTKLKDKSLAPEIKGSTYILSNGSKTFYLFSF